MDDEKSTAATSGDTSKLTSPASPMATELSLTGVGDSDDDDIDGTDDLTGHDNDISGLLRTTVLELETALHDSRQLLEARDRELMECRRERNQLKELMAKEILRKTELSSSLEESRQHVIALEGLIERWQDEVRQVKQREETTRKQLTDHSQRLQTATAECVDAKGESRAATEENGVLKKRIAELEKQLHDLAGDKAVRKGSEKDASEEHDLNWAFLKTSLLHYFTDMHPYQQAKAIVSIMNFNAQERKQIYAKLDEKYGRARSYYSYSRSSSSATS